MITWYDKAYLAVPILVLYTLFRIVRRRSRTDVYTVIALVALLFSILFLFWVPAIEFGNKWWPELERMYWSWISLSMAVLLLDSIPHTKKLLSRKNVGIVIIVHALIIFVQAAVFYMYNVELNFYRLLGGAIDPRVHSDLIFSFRPAGLFLEPSNFAVTLIFLVVLAWKLNASKVVLSMGLLAVLVSGSTVGMVQASLILLMIARKKFAYVAMLTLPVILTIATSHIERIKNIVEIGGGSFIYKVEAFNIWSSFDVWRKVLGSGPGLNDCDCLIADNGLLFSTIFYFGIPVSLYLLYMAKKRSNWLVLIPLLLGKLTLFHPLVLSVLYLKKEKL